MARLTLLSLFLCATAAICLAAPDSASMNPDSGSGTKGGGFGPLMKDRPKDAKTEITAKKTATFDNASNIAVFEGSVVVVDPQFTLYCDKLKVTLNKNRKGLELADAMGNVIIVQTNKDDTTGKVVKSIGRSQEALFNPTTGDITLTVWPSVQHDVNLQVATEATTIMVLNRDGRSTTTGPSKTTIVDQGDQTKS
jgi:lipopolysaccharide transport protein LptA